MKHLSAKLSALSVAALSLLAAGPAQAFLPPAPVCTTLSAQSGSGVTVQECAPTRFVLGTYDVTNSSGQGINEFWVSTLALSGQRYNRAQRQGWSSEYLSEAAWDASNLKNIIGTFDHTFGIADTGLFHYWLSNTITGTAIATGTSSGAVFQFGAPPTSNFLAVQHTGNTYNVLGASLQNVPSVPEPTSLAMMLAGLAGVGLLARRRCA